MHFERPVHHRLTVEPLCEVRRRFTVGTLREVARESSAMGLRSWIGNCAQARVLASNL